MSLTDYGTLVFNVFCNIMGIPINGVYIFTITRNSRLHTNSNILMACLSAADLLQNIVAQPVFTIVRLTEIYNETVLDISPHIHYTSYVVPGGISMFILAIINIDRAMACTKPFFHRVHFTRGRLLTCVLITSLLPFTKFAVPSRKLIAVTVIGGLLVFIIFCSCLITTFKLTFKTRIAADNIQLNRDMLSQRKASKTVLYAVLLTVLLTTPIVILVWKNCWNIFLPWAMACYFCNSFLNSLLYIVRSEAIRREILKLFCPRRDRRALNRVSSLT